MGLQIWGLLDLYARVCPYTHTHTHTHSTHTYTQAHAHKSKNSGESKQEAHALCSGDGGEGGAAVLEGRQPCLGGLGQQQASRAWHRQQVAPSFHSMP